MKYIFVTGGVVSSLGKGLAAASIGTLLEHRGLKVLLQKFDPYLNVVQHIHLAMLERRHRAGIDIEVWVEFLQQHFEAAVF